MDGLVVCAMGGARRRRGFEPRFVCPSRGPPVRSPPPPPSASPSTIGTAGGWVACLVLVFFPCPLLLPLPPAHKNEAPGTAHLQHCPPSLVPPAAGWRISSSYSSSACLRKRTRTRVFRAAAGCTAAAPRCRKPCLSPLCPLSPVLNISVCVWRGGGTQHTINLSYGNGSARAPPRAAFVVCCAVQN